MSVKTDKKQGMTLIAALVAFVVISAMLAAAIPLMTKNDPLSTNSLMVRKDKLKNKIEKLNARITFLDGLTCSCPNSDCFTAIVDGISYKICAGDGGIEYSSVNTLEAENQKYDPYCNVTSVGDGYWGTSFPACQNNAYAGAKKACEGRGMVLPTVIQLQALCNANNAGLLPLTIENLWYWASDNSSAGYAMRVALNSECSANHTNKYNGVSNYVSGVLYGGKEIGDTHALCVSIQD